MPGFENHAGFTITGSKLQLVDIVFNANGFKIENVDEAYFIEPLNIEYDKETKINSLLQSAFDEILIRKNLHSENVSFTLPFEAFYSIQIPYDNTLLHNDLMEEFKWEFSLLYPFINPNELVIQYFEIEKNPVLTGQNVIVFAIPRKYLQIISSFCKNNKLNLKFIDNSHIAAGRVLSVNENFFNVGITLSIYLTHKYVSLIFSFEGKPVYYKLKPIQNASEIIEKIEEELIPKDDFPVSKKALDAVYINGEELSKNLVESLQNSLGIEIQFINPFEKLSSNVRLTESKYFSEKYNTFASAAGIAFRLS